MSDCVYMGPDTVQAKDRVAILQQHQIDVETVDGAGAPPETAPVVVLDCTAMTTDELNETVSNLAVQGTRLLVIFRLAHGASFREQREEIIALGADDVMEASAPPADLLVRTRALMLGARPPFVLVIEDNEKTGPWAVDELSRAGMEALCVNNLSEGRKCFETRTVDVLVVDRNLPDGDGLEFVALLRRNGIRTPALLFTALDAVSDRIRGLSEAGADDYICKPVHGDELCARVQVLLRPLNVDETLFFGPLELGRRDRIARWRGDRVELRPKECDMLIYLAEREGLSIPKRMIFADVWGKVFMDVGSNPVTAARHRLVRDLKTFVESRGEDFPEFIATDGDSYCFRAPPLLRLPLTDAET